MSANTDWIPPKDTEFIDFQDTYMTTVKPNVGPAGAWNIPQQAFDDIEVLQTDAVELGPKHVWKGEILMELETMGSVAWRYTKLSGKDVENRHRFGLKRCIIREEKEDNKMYIYLIGEKDKGYGNEVLIRNLN